MPSDMASHEFELLVKAVTEMTLSDSHGTESSIQARNDSVPKEVYDFLNVNPDKWIAIDVRPHEVDVNPGEDVLEKIASLSGELGERSLSVYFICGLLSSAILYYPGYPYKVQTESLVRITELRGVFELGKISGDLSVSLQHEGRVIDGIIAAGPLIASEPMQLFLMSYLKHSTKEFGVKSKSDVEAVKSSKSDTNMKDSSIDSVSQKVYDFLNVNTDKWIAIDVRPHKLDVNPGEDVLEKIAFLSQELGQRSLSVFSICGLLSSIVLYLPAYRRKFQMKSLLRITELRGAFRLGKFSEVLTMSLQYEGGFIDGIIAAGPLIASEPMQLVLMSYLKHSTNMFEV